MKRESTLEERARNRNPVGSEQMLLCLWQLIDAIHAFLDADQSGLNNTPDGPDPESIAIDAEGLLYNCQQARSWFEGEMLLWSPALAAYKASEEERNGQGEIAAAWRRIAERAKEERSADPVDNPFYAEAR